MDFLKFLFGMFAVWWIVMATLHGVIWLYYNIKICSLGFHDQIRDQDSKDYLSHTLRCGVTKYKCKKCGIKWNEKWSVF